MSNCGLWIADWGGVPPASLTCIKSATKAATLPNPQSAIGNSSYLPTYQPTNLPTHPMFTFRLQKILEYRKTQEEEAKQAFLDRRAACLQAEARIAAIDARRTAMLGDRVTDLVSRIELEARLIRLDDEERFEASALQVLRDEEAAAEGVWVERRRDLKAIGKLRENAFEEWRLAEDRKDQAALDEWAVQRRAA